MRLIVLPDHAIHAAARTGLMRVFAWGACQGWNRGQVSASPGMSPGAPPSGYTNDKKGWLPPQGDRKSTGLDATTLHATCRTALLGTQTTSGANQTYSLGSRHLFSLCKIIPVFRRSACHGWCRLHSVSSRKYAPKTPAARALYVRSSLNVDLACVCRESE